jgi:hypothetical protein
MLLERAATKDPTKKTTFAAMRIGFRPNISENLAQIGVELAAPSRYAEPIQVKPAADPKCSEMVGKAVVIIVVREVSGVQMEAVSIGVSLGQQSRSSSQQESILFTVAISGVLTLMNIQRGRRLDSFCQTIEALQNKRN